MAKKHEEWKISPVSGHLYRSVGQLPQDKASWDLMLKHSTPDPKKYAEAKKWHDATWDEFQKLL